MLVADIVGYLRMARTNEEGTLAKPSVLRAVLLFAFECWGRLAFGLCLPRLRCASPARARGTRGSPRRSLAGAADVRGNRPNFFTSQAKAVRHRREQETGARKTTASAGVCSPSC